MSDASRSRNTLDCVRAALRNAPWSASCQAQAPDATAQRDLKVAPGPSLALV